MSLRSPLGRVRGLGSAKEGSGHWWAQRWTALALLPLILWFIAALVGDSALQPTIFAALEKLPALKL